MPVIHSILPEALTAAVDEVLTEIEHIAHGEGDIVGAATAAAEDGIALIGPFRSADIAEVVEITAPAGLPLLAPVATWAGVTRTDEPVGEDDPSPHHGTVFRLVARDTEVARRIAAYLPEGARRRCARSSTRTATRSTRPCGCTRPVRTGS